jgi:hypothetical protein
MAAMQSSRLANNLNPSYNTQRFSGRNTLSYELQINAVIARIVKVGGDTDEGARDTIVAEVFGGDAAAAKYVCRLYRLCHRPSE